MDVLSVYESFLSFISYNIKLLPSLKCNATYHIKGDFIGYCSVLIYVLVNIKLCNCWYTVGWNLNNGDIQISQNPPASYPTMIHSEQKFIYFSFEWSIVGCGISAFWDLWIGPIAAPYHLRGWLTCKKFFSRSDICSNMAKAAMGSVWASRFTST